VTSKHNALWHPPPPLPTTQTALHKQHSLPPFPLSSKCDPTEYPCNICENVLISHETPMKQQNVKMYQMFKSHMKQQHQLRDPIRAYMDGTICRICLKQDGTRKCMLNHIRYQSKYCQVAGFDCTARGLKRQSAKNYLSNVKGPAPCRAPKITKHFSNNRLPHLLPQKGYFSCHGTCPGFIEARASSNS